MLAWASGIPSIEDIQFTNVNVRGAGDVACAANDYGTWRCVAGAFNSDLPMPGSSRVQAGAPNGAKKS
jgi:hypothetical protein